MSGAGHIKTARLLLDNGADIHSPDESGTTLLHSAAAGGSIELIDLLIKKGAGLHAKDAKGWTPLHFAARRGQAAAIEFLLGKGMQLDAQASDGQTVLHTAAAGGQAELIRLLISRGMDINARSRSGQTALHVATGVAIQWLGGHTYPPQSQPTQVQPYIEVLRTLLDQGADINAADQQGRTALHMAAEEGVKELAGLLLEKGANVNAPQNDGQTALFIAWEKQHGDLVRFLLDKGADVNAGRDEVDSVLNKAIEKGDIAAVQLFISKGAKVTRPGQRGRQPLHVAARFGREDMVKLLLDKGADVNAIDGRGWSVLRCAEYYNRKNVAKLLRSRGADSNAVKSSMTSQPALSAAKEWAAYDLDRIVNLNQAPLADAERELLARNGFVVSGPVFMQVFEAYIESRMPVFITTDSAWHTYHVLLEAGVKQMEKAQATKLARFSQALHSTASRRAGEGKAYRDLTLYAAIGQSLQDPSVVEQLPDTYRTTVTTTLAQLRGQEPVSALFFGLPIMPRQLDAVGFYTSTPELRRYFAARRWYALCDFRSVSAYETELAFRLSLLVNGDRDLLELYQQLVKPYNTMLAIADDGSVTAYLDIARQELGNNLAEESLVANGPVLQKAVQTRLPDPAVSHDHAQRAWPEEGPPRGPGGRCKAPKGG